MPLLPGICPQCGAAIEINSDDKAAICKFCGTPFIVQEAIEKHNHYYNIGAGAVVNIHETESAEMLLKNGETALNIGNYALAKETYQKCTKNYPAEYQGWWGLICAETQNFKNTCVSISLISEYYGYVKKLCSDKSAFNEMSNTFKNYIYLVSGSRVGGLKLEIDHKAQMLVRDTTSSQNRLADVQANLRVNNKEKTHKTIALSIMLFVLVIGLIAFLVAAFGESVGFGVFLFIVFAGIAGAIGWFFVLPTLPYKKLNSNILDDKTKIEATVNHINENQKNIGMLSQVLQFSDDVLVKYIFNVICERNGIDAKITTNEYGFIKNTLSVNGVNVK